MTQSRRDFLKNTTLAAAGSLFLPGMADSSASPVSYSNQTPQPVKAPIRLAVLGGNFGAQFYWHEHPQCKVVAVSDLRPDRLQALKDAYHCERGFASLDALLAALADELDAVALFTPATELADHCIQCLQAGLHVCGASPAALTLPQARGLRDAVASTGLTYFMAETSYYHQPVISAREWYKAGDFGNIFACEAEYHHPGLEELFHDAAGKRTWRYGLPPMLYSAHCTGQLTGVTGETYRKVTAYGWGDDSPILKDNPFKNPFWGETALFETDKGNTLRAQVYWRGALGNTERANWLGQHMSLWAPHPNGYEAVVRRTPQCPQKRPDGKPMPRYEKYDQPLWWQTDRLPAPLRHITPHDGSHGFLTHEFIDALMTGRRPAVTVETALAMAAAGICAHESALQGGKTITIPRVGEL